MSYRGELTPTIHIPAAARVALVRDVTDKRYFGVAMRGGRFVVRLPLGYDGRTNVRWLNGWIFVTHPDPLLPPLLADTTTGLTSVIAPQQLETIIADVKRELKLPQNARVIQ